MLVPFGPSNRSESQCGFVLVSVLWLLVIMTMAATAFSIWVTTVREEAAKRQAYQEGYRRALDALNKVTFTYMAEMKTPQGIAWPATGGVKNEVFFDSFDDFLGGAAPKVKASGNAGFLKLNSSVLDLGQGLRVVVQDHAGLIGLSELSQPHVFDNLIAAAGNSTLSIARLRDNLIDYQDRNSFSNLQGAEAIEYRRKNIPPPTNGVLRHPLQLRAIMDWDTLLATKGDEWLLRQFKEAGGALVNINTAPDSVVALLLAKDGDLAAIKELRNRKTIESIFELTRYSSNGEDVPFTIMPSGGFRFWWWLEGDATAQVYDVQFDHLAPGSKAWYINWSRRVKLPDDLAQSTPTVVNHPFFE